MNLSDRLFMLQKKLFQPKKVNAMNYTKSFIEFLRKKLTTPRHIQLQGWEIRDPNHSNTGLAMKYMNAYDKPPPISPILAISWTSS